MNQKLRHDASPEVSIRFYGVSCHTLVAIISPGFDGLLSTSIVVSGA